MCFWRLPVLLPTVFLPTVYLPTVFLPTVFLPTTQLSIRNKTMLHGIWTVLTCSNIQLVQVHCTVTQYTGYANDWKGILFKPRLYELQITRPLSLVGLFTCGIYHFENQLPQTKICQIVILLCDWLSKWRGKVSYTRLSWALLCWVCWEVRKGKPVSTFITWWCRCWMLDPWIAGVLWLSPSLTCEL